MQRHHVLPDLRNSAVEQDREPQGCHLLVSILCSQLGLPVLGYLCLGLERLGFCCSVVTSSLQMRIAETLGCSSCPGCSFLLHN